MTGNASEEEKNGMLQKAANHLYSVFQKGELSLKKENIQWLAEHYYELAKVQQRANSSPDLKTAYLENSIAAFESLVPKESIVMEGQTEAILLRLSTLFSWSNQIEKKATLLDRFLNPTMTDATPIQKQLLLELARSHQEIGDSLKALTLYNGLIQNYPSSSIRALAILDRSKLLDSYLPQDQKTEENLMYAQNLNDLKDLEVQRSLLSEPLHLEAGLEYIQWKSSLVSEKTAQKQKKIQLLQLFKENFESEFLTEGRESSDPAVQEKEQLLLAYLKFAEAEILRLEATLIETIADSTLVKNNAEKKIQELLHQASLPEMLKKRVEISQKELGQSL